MLFEIKLRLLSATGTPFYSDTIWGHIAWQLKYHYGEERLKEFLKSYPESPTLISNGFPEKHFPKPVLPPMTAEETERCIQNCFGDHSKHLEAVNVIKKLRKITVVPEEFLLDVDSPLSEYSMLERLLKMHQQDKEYVKDVEHDSKKLFVAHNTINRLNFGTLEEGGLFFTEDTFYSPGTVFRIFVQTDFFSDSELKKLFSAIGLFGYGRDASTGKGAFEVISVEAIQPWENNHTNAMMSLSNFVPSKNLSTNGYYELITKYGKLGGEYITDKSIPFKKPLVMMKAGSIFWDADPDQHYGALIQDIHYSDPDVVQFAYLFPLPVYVKNGKEAL